MAHRLQFVDLDLPHSNMNNEEKHRVCDSYETLKKKINMTYTRYRYIKILSVMTETQFKPA